MGDLPIEFHNVRTITHQAASQCIFPKFIDGRYLVTRCKCRELIASAIEKGVRKVGRKAA
jgi:hypothetical protein